MWLKRLTFAVAILLGLQLAACSDSGPKGAVGDLPGADELVPNVIDEDFTLTSDKVWGLLGKVSVYPGATLTVEPGTKIIGSKSPLGWLQIQRGAKIMAEGTASDPIVFTSATTSPNRGDWGGVVVLGKSTNNVSFSGASEKAGIAPAQDVSPGVQLEGDGGVHGGSDAADNSGVLKYVRIEYAGFELSPDNELNALTLGSVGNGTTLDYVQVHLGLDDGIEWFGGTANGTHLVASGVGDDCFDTDQGYQGTVQWAVCMLLPGDGDNGIEASNQDPDIEATPRAKPQFANFTFIGRGDYETGQGNGLRFKEGTEGVAENGIVMGFVDSGLDLDDYTAEGENSDGSTVELNQIIFFANRAPGASSLNDNIADDDNAEGDTNEQYFAANTATNLAGEDPLLTDLTFTSPNLLPQAGSLALECEGPSNAAFDDGAEYCGAMGDEDWMAGWTEFSTDQEGESISGVIDEDTTWSGEIELVGRVAVQPPATLTIEPGTTIKGSKSPLGWLQINRGAKIQAKGTKDNPIVFTSSSDSPQAGDWGGLVILGKAVNNVGDNVELEGNGGEHGGNTDDDNSGTLEYVRVEYAGFELSPDNELNGITLGSAGSGTKLSYVQVHYGLDDGIEWFGGMANGDHLVVSAPDDDCFDTDQGYEGYLQYIVCIQDEGLGDNGVEASNQDPDIDASPRANPMISNFTFIGRGDYSTGEGNGLRYKEGTQGLAINGVIMNFVDSAVDLDDFDVTGKNPDDDSTIELSDIIMFGNTAADSNTINGNVNDDDDSTDEQAFVANTATTMLATDPMLSDISFSASLDLRPEMGSPTTDGTCGIDPTDKGFGEAAIYCGAFTDTTNWMADWTNF